MECNDDFNAWKEVLIAEWKKKENRWYNWLHYYDKDW
jgi:hypothetical protein